MDVVAVNRLNVTIVSDNYYDAMRKNPPIGIKAGISPGRAIQAEHGLSYVIEAVAGDTTGTFMFDFGSSSQVLMNNLSLLGVDPGSMNAFSLSHGHFDHWGGLMDLLSVYREDIRTGTPLYVGREAFAGRFALKASGGDFSDLGCLDREAIEALEKVSVIEVKEPVEVVPGAYLMGDIERRTAYEVVSSTLFVARDDGLEEDDFRGELAVVSSVEGKGLVIVSGCAHTGIVNTIRHAQELTGVEKVHAVVGGFHLVNGQNETIESTIADIKAIGPDYIIPTHCTGFEAVAAFLRAMPDQFILSTAGTQYIFGS